MSYWWFCKLSISSESTKYSALTRQNCFLAARGLISAFFSVVEFGKQENNPYICKKHLTIKKYVG